MWSPEIDILLHYSLHDLLIKGLSLNLEMINCPDWLARALQGCLWFLLYGTALEFLCGCWDLSADLQADTVWTVVSPQGLGAALFSPLIWEKHFHFDHENRLRPVDVPEAVMP